MKIRETDEQEVRFKATLGSGTEVDPYIPYSTSVPLELQVAMYKLPEYSIVDKFGSNLSISIGTDTEDVWEGGGLYPYDANGTAPIQYLSSNNVANTMSISVQGLDINGDMVEQIVALNGQTNVSLTTPLWRVFRLENEGTVDVVDTVYCHTDSSPIGGVPTDANKRALIVGDKNQTQMSLYTIPKGKVGFLYRGELGLQKEGNAASIAEYCRFEYRSRRYGKVFKTKKTVSVMVSQGIYQDLRPFPDLIPDLTDIKITAREVSADMGAWAAFHIMLVDETMFDTDFLAAIGQSGY